MRGGERQIAWLHSGLLEHGVTSTLICKKNGGLAKQNLPETIPVSWHGEWDIAGLCRIMHYCRSLRPSIIHCHDAHGFSHGSVAGALLKIPVVYTRRVCFRIRTDLFTTWKYNNSRKIIAISHAVAQQCEQVVRQNAISIVYDGVDWTQPMLTRKEAREILHIPQDSFVVGTVGYFSHEKNMLLLIQLAAELYKTHSHVCIVCLGTTDARQDAVPANMILTGHIPDAARFYSAFDAYISASTQEGLGSALLDAVVRDIPAVAMDGGGTRDIFPNTMPPIPLNNNAALTSALFLLIDTYSNAQIIARECGIRARKLFSVASMVENTMNVYNEIFSNQEPA